MGKICASFPGAPAECILGLICDFTHTHLHIPRAYCLCIVSSLFIVSQAAAIAVSSVETLWLATVLLGLAYGSLYGSYPSIIIEWFGLGWFIFPRTMIQSTHSLHQRTFLRTGVMSYSHPLSEATFFHSCLGTTWTPTLQRTTHVSRC